MKLAGRLALVSLLHLIGAVAAGILAFGVDLDQLSSRTWWSRGAAAVHDVLWFPHDAVIRAVPNWWLVANARIAVPAAIVANSLVWGMALTAFWTAWRGARARRR